MCVFILAAKYELVNLKDWFNTLINDLQSAVNVTGAQVCLMLIDLLMHFDLEKRKLKSVLKLLLIFIWMTHSFFFTIFPTQFSQLNCKCSFFPVKSKQQKTLNSVFIVLMSHNKTTKTSYIILGVLL